MVLISLGPVRVDHGRDGTDAAIHQSLAHLRGNTTKEPYSTKVHT